MRIQHNIMAMNAYRNYTNNVSAMKSNLEKLSSGYKINRAGDDAAGLAISEKMRAQITGLETAQKNAKDGISLVQTAEGALTEVHDMLNRMVELATQSANGTYDNETDRYQLQKEMDQLMEEIDRIADSSNFNGIKLLDGSLSTSGVKAATSIIIGGNVTSKTSAGAVGIYETTKPIPATVGSFKNETTGTLAKLEEGDSYEFTTILSDGTSQTVSLTLAKDSSGALKVLQAADGTAYDINSAAAPTQSELQDAIVKELNKTSLADQYTITDNGNINFAAKEVGSATPAVSAVDIAVVKADGSRYGQIANTSEVGVKITQSALDAGREIDASSITLYNGENYDEAVFTINGKKFVVATPNTAAASLGEDGADMNAAVGLGSDVTILVADSTVYKGLTTDDDNYAQNIAKIKEVTGLNVGNSVTESDYYLADGITSLTSNGINQDSGIRLTIGEGTLTGGLVLQIGDTADSYNQLRVSIEDCHTKAMGLSGVSISDQASAAAAIDAIKKAINYVSDVRGTLGATQNRLDHTINNLSVMTENIQDAESTIRDTDVAEEMMAYTKNNILIQSAQAMLAQANQIPQGVLQLLQ